MGMKNDAGFSLLELIIYVAIVGIILAVAVPKYNNAIAMANTARRQADLQALDGAIMMYYSENGTYPTGVGDLTDYVKNVDNIQPPKGKCLLRDGSELEITADSYAIDNEENEALCQGHVLADFGSQKGKAGGSGR